MFGCRKYQGLIAASLYEDLSERERRALDTHLSKCATCRADAQALGKFVEAVPDTRPTLDRDLVPVLRARLVESEEPRRPAFAPRWALAAGAAGIVLFLAFFINSDKTAQAPATRPVETAAVDDAELSVLEPVLAQADELIENRQFTQAHAVLEEALREYSGDPLAGEAQERLATLTFSKLQWYDKAYEAYTTLARSYGETYQADRTNIERLNLLDEARKVDFASLRAYDAARDTRNDPIERLVDVIADYPSTYVASMAASDIGRIEAGADSDAEDRLQAMARVRDACDVPVVVAQLNLEIGHIHRDERNDLATARECYVKASQDPVMARLANDALHSLETRSSQ